jgi:uncharacterized protein YbbC (DUF1343 family)
MVPHVIRIVRFSQYGVALLAATLTACGAGGAHLQTAGNPAIDSIVRVGIDVLRVQGAGPLEGRRVGLITNHTGRTADGRTTIDVLHEHPDLELVALFAPEHGIRGVAEAGETIVGGRDVRTGLPIHSLYGETRTPTAEMLEGIDALAFDIQDIGTRYYTYVWTMALAMRTAAEAGVRFVVLDRPNPLGGVHVQGNVLDSAYATFVGLYPVPMRHGLTAGEMAHLLNGLNGYGADLHVVKVSGWRREQWFDMTRLPWLAPSPSMPDLESATHYPGTCLFEGTNLSIGRGTPHAFQQFGAPWLDAEKVVQRLGEMSLPGVRFEAVEFTPTTPSDGKFPGVPVRGVRLRVTDRNTYDPTFTATAALTVIRALQPEQLTFLERHFDRLAGTDRLRLGILAGASMADLTMEWTGQLAAFERIRSAHLLYR